VRRDLFSRHSTRSAPRFIHPDTPPQILDEIRHLPHKPLISVITENAACIHSVRAQWYPYWELCVCADLDAYRGLDPRIKVFQSDPAAAVEMSSGEYLFYPDSPIPPDFLLEVAKERLGNYVSSRRTAFGKWIVRNIAAVVK
jgi:hypothetical protein